MKLIGILLILIGAFCLWASGQAFGDIGLAFSVMGFIAILSGIGFMKVNKRVKE